MIVIMGAGRAGESAAASLVSARNDITVIDPDPDPDTDPERLRASAQPACVVGSSADRR